MTIPAVMEGVSGIPSQETDTILNSMLKGMRQTDTRPAITMAGFSLLNDSM